MILKGNNYGTPDIEKTRNINIVMTTKRYILSTAITPRKENYVKISEY